MEKSKDIITRVSYKFKEELNKIKDERIEKGIDKNKKSDNYLTNLLIKHLNWPIIREDMINYEKD